MIFIILYPDLKFISFYRKQVRPEIENVVSYMRDTTALEILIRGVRQAILCQDLCKSVEMTWIAFDKM